MDNKETNTSGDNLNLNELNLSEDDKVKLQHNFEELSQHVQELKKNNEKMTQLMSQLQGLMKDLN